MSTSSYLANFNVTIDQARTYVFDHLSSPQAIYGTARQFGISNEMLGEIAGYSASDVRSFFDAQGMPARELDPEPLMPPDMLQFASVLALNTATGALSTESLRAQVIARTGASAYAMAFDPNQYAGGLDGVFSAADLGVSTLGSLPATSATLESLFYGTIVRVADSVDTGELAQLERFMMERGAALDREEPAAVHDFLALMTAVVAQPAGAAPAFYESEVVRAAVASAVALVGLASSHGQSLFEELLTGFAAM